VPSPTTSAPSVPSLPAEPTTAPAV
jgi:hypothetical protein